MRIKTTKAFMFINHIAKEDENGGFGREFILLVGKKGTPKGAKSGIIWILMKRLLISLQ